MNRALPARADEDRMPAPSTGIAIYRLAANDP
jgi:hypothetical protein